MTCTRSEDHHNNILFGLKQERQRRPTMKVARFLVAAWCATETASAFVPSSSAGWSRRSGHRRPTDDDDDLAMAPVDSSQMDPYSTPAIFLAGAGATFFAAFATFQKDKIDGGGSNARSTKKRSGGRSRAPAEPPRVDLSIPYDAAATLAYDAARAATTTSKKKFGFEAFRSLYEAQVVAEVRAKARIRNLNEEAEELRERLAALEGEIAGNGGDLASLNDEAAGFRAQIQELFR